ncbi:hypothetical protein M0R45_015738 [Rubus argutus]|uniref:Uncharacterized protein n=1 Tax=Rubus argutus TaxID=59490 RepID=A0AAW1XSZ1_RUBAR
MQPEIEEKDENEKKQATRKEEETCGLPKSTRAQQAATHKLLHHKMRTEKERDKKEETSPSSCLSPLCRRLAVQPPCRFELPVHNPAGVSPSQSHPADAALPFTVDPIFVEPVLSCRDLHQSSRRSIKSAPSLPWPHQIPDDVAHHHRKRAAVGVAVANLLNPAAKLPGRDLQAGNP